MSGFKSQIFRVNLRNQADLINIIKNKIKNGIKDHIFGKYLANLFSQSQKKKRKKKGQREITPVLYNQIESAYRLPSHTDSRTGNIQNPLTEKIERERSSEIHDEAGMPIMSGHLTKEIKCFWSSHFWLVRSHCFNNINMLTTSCIVHPLYSHCLVGPRTLFLLINFLRIKSQGDHANLCEFHQQNLQVSIMKFKI